MFKRSRLPVLALILVGCCSSWAQYTPFDVRTQLPILESEIVDFMADSKEGERLSVIVLYHSQNPSAVGMSRVRFESFLRDRLNRLQRQVIGEVSLHALSTIEPLWLAQASIVSLTKRELARLAADSRVRRLIWAKRPIFLSQPLPSSWLDIESSRFTYGLEHIKVPEARTQFPAVTGSGVRVGIIDTGIAAQHPDLAGKVLNFRNFTSTFNSPNKPFDDHGHGTHVAGTIAGGAASGQHIGVAPGVQLLIAKAFGSYGGTETAWLLSSMEWLANPDGDPNTADHAQVINTSWNNDEDMAQIVPEDSPFCVAISNLSQLGVIVVGSAGNEGPATKTVRIPSTCPGALSVASSDDTDAASDFSSRGMAHWKNMTLQKPEVTAPGSTIYSASADGGYRYNSGTSMASPHAAGVVALLLHMQPSLDHAKILSVLQDSSRDLGAPGADATYGYGLLDVEKALSLLPKR